MQALPQSRNSLTKTSNKFHKNTKNRVYRNGNPVLFLFSENRINYALSSSTKYAFVSAGYPFSSFADTLTKIEFSGTSHSASVR